MPALTLARESAYHHRDGKQGHGTMTELVTHNEDRPGPKGSGNGSKARAVGAVLVSGNQLSRHLGISRQAVDQARGAAGDRAAQ